jgi:hypothetical protein
MIVDNGKYYLYRYIRIDNHLPFYIGIGTKRKNRNYISINTEYERAYCKTKRNRHFLNIVATIDYSIEILCESDSLEFIKEKEKELITLYGRVDKKTGCLVNLTDGGDGHFNMSDENRQNLSELATIRFKGVPKSNEFKLKTSQWQIGRKFTDESIKKRTETRKQNAIKRGYYVNPNKIKKESKSVLQYNTDNVLIKEWVSICEVNRCLKIPKHSIINVCKMKPRYKTARGFIWRYKELF